jgi:hypothetical protein
MPTGVLVTVVVVPLVATEADAVMFVAPAESMLAVFKVMEAMPLAFVNAVAEVGVNVTRPLVAAKVTTAFGTTAPLASLSVAVAVTGVPNVTLEGMLKVRELRSVVVVPVPVVAPLPHPLRQQNKTKRIIRFKKDKSFFLVDFAILLSFYWGTDDVF